MGLGIDILVAGRTIYVPTTMTLNVFETHFAFEASYTFTPSEADAGLCPHQVLRVVGAMVLETIVTKKVASTSMATLRGFETASVSVEEIGALFLHTGATLEYGLTAMTSSVVVGFETMGTDVTGAKKPRETGNDIVVTFFVK